MTIWLVWRGFLLAIWMVCIMDLIWDHLGLVFLFRLPDFGLTLSLYPRHWNLRYHVPRCRLVKRQRDLLLCSEYVQLLSCRIAVRICCRTSQHHPFFLQLIERQLIHLVLQHLILLRLLAHLIPQILNDLALCSKVLPQLLVLVQCFI